MTERQMEQRRKASPFIRGHKINVGRAVSEKTRKKISDANAGRAMRGRGWHVTEETRKKMREAQAGENNHNWRGNDIGYWGIHRWLIKTFGKANKCENINCSKLGREIQWALLKGKSHQRKRENYIMLCEKCHKKYDGKPHTKETKGKMSVARKRWWINRAKTVSVV